VIIDGIGDVARTRPLSRLGDMDFAIAEDVFAMARPVLD